jgi:hypothetical protein
MVCCEDFKKVKEDHPFLFQKHSEYGTILHWIELSDEGTFHKKNDYGIQIKYCIFCGARITE